ncbi:peptide ABC transporter substrate-binding protein [uncultured Veillonella sp.]|uniref:peptide ABC transporter substrate-binding protein n=1 Tax=uncultured Veillonella sp. TaxID=159268 RepID=UPI00260BE391|nr:peptide ABC transporter substrate-binding protein [uncultured Veillonella sp.]
MDSYRRIMARWVVLFSALCLLVVFLGGCRSSDAVPPNTLRLALEQEPSTLDPAKSSTLPESIVELAVFEGLTRLNDKDLPEPAMAQSWSISADGLVYTFHLRPDATWSDGVPVTAHDFEYAWKRVLNPQTAAGNAYMLYVLKNGEAYNTEKATAQEVGVKALDDHTLQVVLEAPAPYFLGLTAFHAYYPVRQDIVEKAPHTWATKADTLIGNGPFVLTKWIHSGELNFVKNERYWDAGAVKLAAMDWPISESQSTRLTLAEGGAVDMMVEPPVLDQKRLTEAGLFKVSPSLGTYYYVFNVTAPPFDDPRVRKAFSLVIDRQVIVDTIVHGGKTPAYAFVPPGLMDEQSKVDFRQAGGDLVSHDVSAAKALLKEAGYGPNKPLPKVTILYNTNELHKAIAEAVQAIWKNELGADVELQNQETKVFMSNREEGHYQVARASWVGDYVDPQTFLDVFSDEANDAQYHSAAYNDIMARVHNTTNPVVRQQLMHEAEQMLFDDAVVIPIYFTTTPYVANDSIGGYFWSSLGIVDFKTAYRK